ncbi:ribosomal RNA processing protein 1 homolog A isoform X2 [Boleophthalmus pectinirostris]|uniref:ribosomal RNA processing protein 1 homolog A isoform X2 n=1 Tax=Boleophthalmus pectinirostris TaxID=150288 RepID=UPI002432FEA1|nr:ribosomal RNA processing protein 1 homolog A isoform X2 [Boleophthalmus pectinirostris]
MTSSACDSANLRQKTEESHVNGAMACAEPEVQFAQKLASNEKPVRRKALKKLRAYISARCRTHAGFSEEELLKLWKGLFYCLWMQDKLLLQEELSTQISGLVHHFHSFSAQLLFLRTFLTTVKREWTGIDRLRMDKYYQLVRFMFRQMFELLQRSQWDPSCIAQFLGLLSFELLQAGAPPVGLQMHVLDLYLRELAVVGAQELTADQNLVFIEPFMKTAAKTKDRALFRAICSSIFSTIIDQAPFAIQELLEELEQDSDSGQASEDQEEPEEQLKTRAGAKKTKAAKAKATAQMNGTKSHPEEDEDDEDDEDEEEDDGLSDSEHPVDEDVGPVLQFDYGAVADKLLELSSRGNTPSRNRQRLYKIVRVLRDLSQGSFPQDEYPEEVSTDEDDDDFGSRKRVKRKHTEEEEEEEEPEQKKAKGKKKPPKPSPEASSSVTSEEGKKKKRKKKKKKKSSQSAAESTDKASIPETETQAPLAPQDQPEDLPEDQPEPAKTPQENNTTPLLKNKKRKKAKKSEVFNEKHQNGPTVEEQDILSEPKPTAAPPDTLQTETAKHPTEEDTAQTTLKKKRKKRRTESSESGPQHEEVTTETQAEDTVQPEPKKRKKKVTEKLTMETGAEETQQESEAPMTSVKATKKRKAAGQKRVQEDTGVGKKRKKKKIIPVEFEYEAEVPAEETIGRPSDPSQTLLSSRPQKLQMNQTAQPDFVRFQSSSPPPAPLFCRALCTKTSTTPKSDSKKVRFGLKNNQTAEFRRTDRSLLLSPEGSSRVPFDPDQKPKCGVLKSPPTPFPKPKKKSGARARPTAADFF